MASTPLTLANQGRPSHGEGIGSMGDSTSDLKPQPDPQPRWAAGAGLPVKMFQWVNASKITPSGAASTHLTMHDDRLVRPESVT